MLGGHINAYLRLLRCYALDHASDGERLEEWLLQGNLDDIRRLAHTLKSSSANLGASRVQQLAIELELAVKEAHGSAQIENLTWALVYEVNNLTAAICAALPEDAAITGVDAVAWSAVWRVLDELEPLLTASSLQANDVSERYSALLNAALGPLGVELEGQIRRFLYAEALETLRKAREKHQKPQGPMGAVDEQ